MSESNSSANPFRSADVSGGDAGHEQLSVFGESLFIKGELQAAENLLIEGRLEGTVKHTADKLIIGSKGRVKAEIHAQNLIIEGEVEGDVHCAESVSIKESAVLLGNIFSPRLSIADGARFNGSVDMKAGKGSTPKG